MISQVKNILTYREFVLSNVKRELSAKYRNSLLGGVWNIIHPLSMIAIYTVIFSEVMGSRIPSIDNKFAYSIYLCSGILLWNLFSEILNRSQGIFIDNANLLKKLSFPKILLPVIAVANSAANFLIVFCLYLLFLAFSSPATLFSFSTLSAIPVLALVTAFAAGLGLAVGVVNVFFRDLGQLMTIGLSFWFWLTPIIYPANAIPAKIAPLLALNPMSAPVRAFQDIFLYGKSPVWSTLVFPATVTILLLAIAAYLYRSNAADIVDEL